MKNNNLVFTNGMELPVGTMYCIGQNYAKHVVEMGSAPATNPIVFLKPPAAYLEDGGTIKLPVYSNSVHHEIELVVVIGKEYSGGHIDDALDCVAGYAVGIDLTLRDIQKKAKEAGHPWAVAKGFAGSAPISKVVPIENISSEQKHFNLELKINGEIRQKGSTKDMERSVETLIEYLANIFTLRAGDVIFTGTPEGVGEIKDGDIIEAELNNFVSLKISASR